MSRRRSKRNRRAQTGADSRSPLPANTNNSNGSSSTTASTSTSPTSSTPGTSTALSTATTSAYGGVTSSVLPTFSSTSSSTSFSASSSSTSSPPALSCSLPAELYKLIIQCAAVRKGEEKRASMIRGLRLVSKAWADFGQAEIWRDIAIWKGRQIGEFIKDPSRGLYFTETLIIDGGATKFKERDLIKLLRTLCEVQGIRKLTLINLEKKHSLSWNLLKGAHLWELKSLEIESCVIGQHGDFRTKDPFAFRLNSLTLVHFDSRSRGALGEPTTLSPMELTSSNLIPSLSRASLTSPISSSPLPLISSLSNILNAVRTGWPRIGQTSLPYPISLFSVIYPIFTAFNISIFFTRRRTRALTLFRRRSSHSQ